MDTNEASRPSWWAGPYTTLLEVIRTYEEGWQPVGHPTSLEDAIAIGKSHGGGLYIFEHLTDSGLKMDWFGLVNGEFAGVNPYGWPQTPAC